MKSFGDLTTLGIQISLAPRIYFCISNLEGFTLCKIKSDMELLLKFCHCPHPFGP